MVVCTSQHTSRPLYTNQFFFHEDSLVELLAKNMSEYSADLHHALVRIRTYFEQPKDVRASGGNLVRVKNKLVADGHHEQQKWGQPRLSAEEISESPLWTDPAGCEQQLPAPPSVNICQPPQPVCYVPVQWPPDCQWAIQYGHPYLWVPQPPWQQQWHALGQQQGSWPPQQQPWGPHPPPNPPPQLPLEMSQQPPHELHGDSAADLQHQVPTGMLFHQV